MYKKTEFILPDSQSNFKQNWNFLMKDNMI